MRLAETYVLWNLIMDAFLAACAARAVGRGKAGPVFEAAALGAGYALVCRLQLVGGLASPPIALGVGALMALIAARPRDAAETRRAVFALYAAALFTGGAQMLALRIEGAFSGPIGALAGAGLYWWTTRASHTRVMEWHVHLRVETDHGCARLRALVDTGNRLHEPLSGLPVLIAEERALRRALPEDFDAEMAARRPPAGFRLVAYGVLGGAGAMACFKPRCLLVSYGSGWLRAPDIWVAVYPGRIPGTVSALAPTVIGTIEAVGTTTATGDSRGTRLIR